jgi:hypothetical protein
MFVDQSTIYNIQDFKLIENFSTCTICGGILWEPMQCSVCDNSFCKNCLNSWFKQSKQEICPFKCPKSSFKESKLVKKMLSILKFNCPNNCDEPIPYEELFSHIRLKCKKVDFKKKYYDLKKKFDELMIEYKNLVPDVTEEMSSRNNVFKSIEHIHPLIWLSTDRMGWLCNVCDVSHHGNVKSYYCTLCDYDLCSTCKKKEEKKHK